LLSQMAAKGLGIALQPTFIAGDLIKRGELLPLLTDYQWPSTSRVYPIGTKTARH